MINTLLSGSDFSWWSAVAPGLGFSLGLGLFLTSVLFSWCILVFLNSSHHYSLLSILDTCWREIPPTTPAYFLFRNVLDIFGPLFSHINWQTEYTIHETMAGILVELHWFREQFGDNWIFYGIKYVRSWQNSPCIRYFQGYFLVLKWFYSILHNYFTSSKIIHF